MLKSHVFATPLNVNSSQWPASDTSPPIVPIALFYVPAGMCEAIKTRGIHCIPSAAPI